MQYKLRHTCITLWSR